MTNQQKTLINLMAGLRAASDAASECAVRESLEARAQLEVALARVFAEAGRTQISLGLDNERVCALACAQLEGAPLAAH